MLLGFSKSDWQAIHTIFSYTFVILSVFHLFFLNWKAFWSYFVSKTSSGIKRQRELVISIVLIGFIFLGTYFNFQPFKAVIDFGEWTTESWETKEEQPPIPHAELLTIKELQDKYTPMPADSILLLLRQNGLKADSVGQTIQEISDLNNLTSAKVFSIISSKNLDISSILPKPQTQGMGRKTIAQIAQELGKDVNETIEILEENGIKAKPEDKLKDIADAVGKTPMELLEMIK
jgi:hypothetical protein